MRIAIAVVAGALAILAASPAAAQPGGDDRPWCIRDGVSGPGMWDCSYYNQQQCLASASGAGGWCTRNPWYRPQGKSKKRRKPRN
ncbi:MAG: DUF3551 domain-containing protein [Xanthobacteraceae bacterium]